MPEMLVAELLSTRDLMRLPLYTLLPLFIASEISGRPKAKTTAITAMATMKTGIVTTQGFFSAAAKARLRTMVSRPRTNPPEKTVSHSPAGM